MNISIPRERSQTEFRVGLSPAGVRSLSAKGHTCHVEAGAGVGAGFSDQAYMQAGGEIVYSGEEAYGRAELVLKANRPAPEELPWILPNQILTGYLHLGAAPAALLERLQAQRVTALAYEWIELSDGTFPVQAPLSQIGGRMAAQLAARLLQNDAGGKGVLLGGVPGVPGAEVVIIGAGDVGEYAARAFVGLGAQVTLLDTDLTKLKDVCGRSAGPLVTMLSTRVNIAKACGFADVVVGAVRAGAGRAPIVIERSMLMEMKPGALLLDLSIDDGGCSESSRPTTHENPTYIESGVVHCCIPNLPGVVARTATHATQNAAWPYIKELAGLGLKRALSGNPALARAVAVDAGELHHGLSRPQRSRPAE